MTWALKCTWCVCCCANNAGNCCIRLREAKSLTGFKLCATKSNNMQQGVQTDATCNIQQCCVLLRGALEYLHFCLSKALCKRTQHRWMLLVASVCTACCMLLRVVLLGVVAFVFTPLKHATLLAQQYLGLLRPFAP